VTTIVLCWIAYHLGAPWWIWLLVGVRAGARIYKTAKEN